ncbi:MAG: hypothetical protein IT317_17200 [Anaerolineales bacterium]|nr:hypothetical protein [Anaerolineales bacterium]
MDVMLMQVGWAAVVMVAGAGLVALPYVSRGRAARGARSLSASDKVLRGWRRFMRYWRVRFRAPEQGGYVHDTSMSLAIHPNQVMKSAGTWTEVETSVADVWALRRSAADATCNVRIPVLLPSNSAAQKGAYLKSVDVYYTVATAALDSLAAAIYETNLPADGAAAVAATAHAFSYDSGHDTAPERIDVDEHAMTLTLTTPVWLDAGDLFHVEVALDAAATSVFDFLGARVNYTLRL